ncbi:hypothetical protein I7I51_03039 [Histoplasma capsulatum]|uniref:Cyclin-D1-binding protein 1-like N-terminal domain-containing protein n=1 Tax=Ajellomyces capsulatus TaxID=5037 RepID=A0A8A1MRZ8_AJECA|nr:predicted protein [Histoplasma mississippiense (nom. inval.)]EDN11252.1 predicted protein [Histoplasma mississippiense (nom. inval.)]QSS66827.1 hypothetical protein I7I51_03039 [Histoplasma capsulatum]
MPPTLSSILEATSIIIDQSNAALSTPLCPPANTNSSNSAQLSLPLLSTSAASLKAQTTKLSLLSVNIPFTPSALITVLSVVNESILPSLVTAALLTIPAESTQAFHNEAKLLVKDILREFGGLIEVLKVIANGGSGGDNGKEVTVTEQQKGDVMACTGRLWKVCEQLLSFAEGGLAVFVVGKVRQYFELVRDGIRELEEWDPEEDDDDGEDDLFWDYEVARNNGDELWCKENKIFSKGSGTVKGKDKASGQGSEDDTTSAIAKLLFEKAHLLRLLNPIAQIYPAIISHRLKRQNISSSPTCSDQQQKRHHSLSLSATQISQLDRLLQHLRELPNLVDEAAGSLYDHDIDNAVMYTNKLCKCAFAAAEVARMPLIGNGNDNVRCKESGGNDKGEENAPGEEDKFPKWADTWMRVVEEITRSKGKAKGVES